MKSRANKVDPYPCMMRGESAFEEKRIEAEFTLTFARVVELALSDLRGTYEYVYRQGYFAGKTAGKREGLGSPITETLNTSPQDASVRETAGAIKEIKDGITESD